MTHPLLNEALAAQHRRELSCDAETRRRAGLRGRFWPVARALSAGGGPGTLDR